MDLQQWAHVATIVGAAASTVMGVATVAILYFTYRLNKRSQELARQSKQADVIGEYNARFSRTWEMRANPNIVENPLVFYERFWSLQFDQFHSWRQGFIPEDIFYYWVASRYDDWIANKPLGAMQYKDGFQRTVGEWKGSEFKDFMTTLHEKGVDKAISSLAPPNR